MMSRMFSESGDERISIHICDYEALTVSCKIESFRLNHEHLSFFTKYSNTKTVKYSVQFLLLTYIIIL